MQSGWGTCWQVNKLWGRRLLLQLLNLLQQDKGKQLWPDHFETAMESTAPASKQSRRQGQSQAKWTRSDLLPAHRQTGAAQSCSSKAQVLPDKQTPLSLQTSCSS